MPPRLPSSSYWRVSRAPRYSLLFALPLLALYEAMAAAMAQTRGPQIRNGAEVLLKSVLAPLAGARTSAVVFSIVVVICVGLAARDLRRAGGGLRLRVFGMMLAESAVLAALCGVIVGVATAKLLHAVGPRLAMLAPGDSAGGVAHLGAATRLMLSLGAGLYEELVFRVLLVGALAYGFRRFVGAGPVAAGIAASVIGAIVFSLAHYVGALGDPFTLQSFTFRALAGLFFSVLYVTRGFGITAWAHALYDVVVLLF
jgi:hypothetical protein